MALKRVRKFGGKKGKKLIVIASKVEICATLLHISCHIEEFTQLIRIDISKIYPDGYIYMLAISRKKKHNGNKDFDTGNARRAKEQN